MTLQADSGARDSGLRSPEQESKHTRGPWTIGLCGSSVDLIYGTKEAICQVFGLPMNTRVSEINNYETGLLYAQGLANARRIVQCVNAHDELVEALELLLKWSNPIVSEHVKCVEFAKATVAKAKGEA